MNSLRFTLLDKRYSRFTRSIGKQTVGRTIPMPITADAMLPGIAESLGMNTSRFGRLAMVEAAERHLGKARAFAFRVACQLRDEIKGIFSPRRPEEQAEVMQADADRAKAEKSFDVTGGAALIDNLLKLDSDGEFEPTKEAK